MRQCGGAHVGYLSPTRPGHVSQLIETRLHSQELCKGEFLHAVRDTVALPDGSRAGREYVIHPGAVMVVPLLQEGDDAVRLVMERQFRYPMGRVMLEFPAGKVDPGEESLACAQRELAEETGYLAGEWAYAGQLHPVVSYSTESIDIWFARKLKVGAPKLDAGEFLEVFTATPTELFDGCRNGAVTDAKTLVAALWLQNMLSGLWPLNWLTPTQTAARHSPHDPRHPG